MKTIGKEKAFALLVFCKCPSISYFKISCVWPTWEDRNWDVENFCKKLIKNQYLAFCGKIRIVDNEKVLTNIAKVLPQISKGKYCLTTMADDDDTNNLVTLDEYYK